MSEKISKKLKAEHKATNPSAFQMLEWNRNNAEKFTKAEHKAAKPSAYKKCMKIFPGFT